MFQSLFQYSNNGIVILTAVEDGNDFIIKDFNPAAERIEKLTKAEVVGKKVTEVFPGIEAFSLLTTMRNVYRTGKAENHPTTFYKDERIEGWRENFVYKAKTGEIINVYYDRTEEKKIQEKHAAIINALPDLFFRFDKYGVYLDCWTSNPKLLYPSQKALVGQKVDEVLPPEVAEQAHKLITRVIETKEPGTLEYWLSLEDGKKYFESRLVYDTDNTVLAIVRDVTDRQFMLDELGKRELKYNTLFKAHPDTIILTSSIPDGRILDINEAGTVLMGYTKNELIGRTTTELKLWKRDEDRKKYIEILAKNKFLSNFETVINTKYGHIDVLVTAEVVDIGKEKYHLNIFRNISDIRKINKKLKYNEQKFKDIVENISEIVVEMDDEFKITYANNGFYQFSGYTEEELETMRWPDFFQEPHQSECKNEHTKAILEKNTNIRNFIADFITKSGQAKILSVQWKIAFMNGDGVRTYVIARDVTEEETKRRVKRQQYNQKLLSIETDLRMESKKEQV